MKIEIEDLKILPKNITHDLTAKITIILENGENEKDCVERILNNIRMIPLTKEANFVKIMCKEK